MCLQNTSISLNRELVKSEEPGALFQAYWIKICILTRLPDDPMHIDMWEVPV